MRQADDVADLSGSTGTGGGDSGKAAAVVSSLQQTLCALALHFRQVSQPPINYWLTLMQELHSMPDALICLFAYLALPFLSSLLQSATCASVGRGRAWNNSHP
jgi:hypothetical protein